MMNFAPLCARRFARITFEGHSRLRVRRYARGLGSFFLLTARASISRRIVGFNSPSFDSTRPGRLCARPTRPTVCWQVGHIIAAKKNGIVRTTPHNVHRLVHRCYAVIGGRRPYMNAKSRHRR